MNLIISSSLRTEKNKIKIDFILLSLIWFALAFFLDPLGDFPLNDDWVYGLSVKNFLEFHEFRPISWSAVTLISNTLWGAIFTIPYGFSFDALRISTIIISLFGILTFYLLIIRISKSRLLAIIGSLSLAFNPIYFSLSFTFMTDVPCLTFVLLATFFFVKAIKNESNLDLIIATIFSIIATLSRQFSIAIPLAYAVSSLITNKKTFAITIKHLSPLLVTIIFFIAFEFALLYSGHMPGYQLEQYTKIFHTAFSIIDISNLLDLTEKIISRSVKIILYMSLFLVPILLTVQWNKFELSKKYFWIALPVLFIFSGSHLFPPEKLGNILCNYGIGPIALRDIFFLKINAPNSLPLIFWVGITLVTVIASSLLIFLGSKNINSISLLSKEDKTLNLFFIFTLLIYSCIYIKIGFFDRYLLNLFPFLFLSIIFILKPIKAKLRNYSLAFLYIIFLGGFSFFTTSDYLIFHKTKFLAIDSLIKSKNITSQNIDGGYEYNGYYNYSEGYVASASKSWWWVEDDTYIITLGPVSGYSILNEYKLKQFFPYSSSIFVLKKN